VPCDADIFHAHENEAAGFEDRCALPVTATARISLANAYCPPQSRQIVSRSCLNLEEASAFGMMAEAPASHEKPNVASGGYYRALGVKTDHDPEVAFQ
jgi:hypothetical protein